jgi:hypothetical protein
MHHAAAAAYLPRPHDFLLRMIVSENRDTPIGS